MIYEENKIRKKKFIQINMLWHGKRCEATPATLEEQKEMEELLSRFK